MFAANGKARCATCHVPPLYTEPGFNLHTPEEIGIDAFQASALPTDGYRTTPLRGLWTHTKGGFYHDGRFANLRCRRRSLRYVSGLGTQREREVRSRGVLEVPLTADRARAASPTRSTHDRSRTARHANRHMYNSRRRKPMTRRLRSLAAALFVAGTLPATSALAHHSVGLYDTEHLTTVKGVVTRIEWTSPHVFVYFTADDGKAEWSMELDPPVLLRRYGWSKELVNVGDAISARVRPLARAQRRCAARSSSSRTARSCASGRASRHAVAAGTVKGLSYKVCPTYCYFSFCSARDTGPGAPARGLSRQGAGRAGRGDRALRSRASSIGPANP